MSLFFLFLITCNGTYGTVRTSETLNKLDYYVMIFVRTYRLANAGEIRGRLIVSANCVSAAVIQNVTADMVLHTLAHTVAVIAVYADAFMTTTVAGRHALRVHVALGKIRRAIGRHASIVHIHAESGLAGAFVARVHGVVGALFVLPALGIVVALV